MISYILKRNNSKNLFKGIIKYYIDVAFRINCIVDKMVSSKQIRKRKLLFYKLSRKYLCFVSYKLEVGKNFNIVHPFGVVIGGAKIGDNCRIYQNVTIGQKDGFFPKIGDNVTIYSGAVIIGDISIGSNCIIGANAVVTKSFPDNSLIVGVPAINKNDVELKNENS